MVSFGRRKRRVRMHLIEHDPRIASPSVEGLLIGRHGREYEIAVPQVLMAADREPVVLDEARSLMIPVDQVQFFEVLR